MPALDKFSFAYKTLLIQLEKEQYSQSIKNALTICKELNTSIAQRPLYILGLCFSRIKNENLDHTNVSITRTVAFIHLCRANQYNTTSSSILSAGLILSFATQQIDENTKKVARKHILKRFEHLGYESAADLIRIVKLLALSDPARYLSQVRLTHWQWLAVSVSVLLTDSGKQVWQQNITRLFYVTPSWLHHSLQHLLIYPSLCIPGTQLEHKSEKYWVLCNHGSNLVLSNGEDYVQTNQASCTPVVNYNFDKQTFNKALLDYDNDNIYPLTYKIDRPPKSLLLVLKQCQQYNVDIDELTQRIEREPSFSRFMCESATNSNRLKISVSSVKQAIMTYGTERLGDMLTTHALFERLTQSSFPLKETFITHVTLSMEIAAYLAKESQLILPQTASLLALLCHSPLFTNAKVKNLTSWKTCSVEQHGFKHLISTIPIDDLRIASINLAKAWGTSPTHIAAMNKVLTDSNSPTSSVPAIIQLSLEWSIAIRHGSFKGSHYATSYEQKLCKCLGVTLSSKATCIHGLSELLYCNLVKR